jgi:hypothetical protein
MQGLLKGAWQMTWCVVHSPYKYGFVFEQEVLNNGSYVVSKHYLLGRVAHELAYVCSPHTIASNTSQQHIHFFFVIPQIRDKTQCLACFGQSSSLI